MATSSRRLVWLLQPDTAAAASSPLVLAISQPHQCIAGPSGRNPSTLHPPPPYSPPSIRLLTSLPPPQHPQRAVDSPKPRAARTTPSEIRRL